jgi:DNA repair exonuclease SbcCD ATPase subunit
MDINKPEGEVFVQACREADQKFLQTAEGQAMINAAIAHIKTQLPERDYSKPQPNMGVDAFTLVMDLNSQLNAIKADRDEWKQQHENLLSVRQSDLEVITALRTQLASAQAEKAELIATILERGKEYRELASDFANVEAEKAELVKRCAAIAKDRRVTNNYEYFNKYAFHTADEAILAILEKDKLQSTDASPLDK